MKKLFISLIMFSISLYTNAQVIDLSNAKANKTINPVEYDGSYLIPNYSTTNEMRAGLVNQKITIIKVSQFNVKTMDDKYISSSDVAKLENKEWKIVDYVNDNYNGSFKISNDTLLFYVDFNSLDVWFISNGLKTLQNNLIEKLYVPFKKSLKIKSIDGTEFILSGTTPIKLINLQYAKLDTYKYGIALFFNNGLIIEYDNEHQLRGDGWIEVGSMYSGILLVENNTMNLFSIKNNKYIEKMREGMVAIGMSQKQVGLSWGSAKIYDNIAGYDKVYEYNSHYLYFKNEILELIKEK